MSAGGAAALAAGAVFTLVVSVVLFAVALARTAAHADEVALEHERQARARDAGSRMTISQSLAVMDGRLQVVREQLVAWPDDEYLLRRRDQLLDERAWLMRAAATSPRARVVRQAAHP